MDKDTLTTITKLAKAMPKHHQETTRTLTGDELLNMGFTTWEGGDVQAGKKYRVPVRVETNNVRWLTRLYNKGGMKAVRDVVNGRTQISVAQ